MTDAISSSFAGVDHQAPSITTPSGTLAGRRILVYGMNYAPEIAGVGRYTGEIAEHFAASGADVTVVTTPPHYPGWVVQKGFKNRYASARENDVQVIRCPLMLRRQMNGIWRLLAPLSFALTSGPIAFWQILAKRPQTVFCVEPTLFASPLALLAGKLVGAKTVLHVQDLEVDAAFAVGHLGRYGWLKRLGFAFEKFTLKRFSSVITISNRMSEKLQAKGVAANRLSIVRNWVDLDHIYPMDGISPYRAELGYEPDDFIVLYSGNIGVKQGLPVLLDAAERLKDNPKIKFIIAGEGPAKEELQSRYGHLPAARFLPFQPYARLNEFLNLADLHALPQDKGTADLVLPSKLGGMLASGKPIVVTAEKGTELSDFLGDAALIVEPGDEAALAGGIAAAQSAGARDTGQAKLAKTLERKQGVAGFMALVAAE